MDVDLVLVEVLWVALLFSYIIWFIRNLLKHRAIYALKGICNSIKCPLWTLGGVYISVFGVMPISQLIEGDYSLTSCLRTKGGS